MKLSLSLCHPRKLVFSRVAQGVVLFKFSDTIHRFFSSRRREGSIIPSPPPPGEESSGMTRERADVGNSIAQQVSRARYSPRSLVLKRPAVVLSIRWGRFSDHRTTRGGRGRESFAGEPRVEYFVRAASYSTRHRAVCSRACAIARDRDRETRERERRNENVDLTLINRASDIRYSRFVRLIRPAGVQTNMPPAPFSSPLHVRRACAKCPTSVWTVLYYCEIIVTVT